MLCLSGFELYSRWVPLITGHFEGIQVVKRLSQGSLKHRFFYTSRHFESKRNYFKIKLQAFFVGGTAFNCLIGLSTLLTEHANFCLLADVLLVFQTIFTICIQVFLNFETIRKEEVLFNKLNFILIAGKLVQ